MDLKTNKTSIARHIQLATTIARIKGKHKRYGVGAILVKHGKAISSGANSYKTHPKMGIRTLHAEIATLIGVQYQDIRNATMFVARLNHQGDTGMARPCSTCRKILKEYGIKEIFFTSPGGSIDSLVLE